MAEYSAPGEISLLPPPPDQPRQRKLCSILDACTLMGVSRRTIYNWLEAGKLDTVRTAGGRLRIYVDSLYRADAAKERKDVESSAEAS